MNRREFLSLSTLLAAPEDDRALFKISLTPWSLMRVPHGEPDPEGIDLLEFPGAARELGFDAIEHDNLHYPGDLPNEKVLGQMKQRCEQFDLTSTMILCGRLGDIASRDKRQRNRAVANYTKWAEAAKYLDCASIRVVCADVIEDLSPEEKMRCAVDGATQLTENVSRLGLNLLIENHGGYTSNPEWLSLLVKNVGRPDCGVLADFTGWQISRNPESYWPDPYGGMRILAPHARAAGAKATHFDADGDESTTDFYRMMKILVDAGFQGNAAVEWNGNQPSRREGALATRRLLEKVRRRLATA